MKAALRATLFLLTVPGTVLLYVPLGIAAAGFIRPDPSAVLRMLAVLAWCMGLAVSVWVVVAFALQGGGTPAPNAPTRALVQSGLYRYSRNPMYIGALLVVLGYPLWFQSLALVLYWFAILLFFQAVIVVYEEASSERRFGDAWRTYRRRVPRWLIAGGRS